MIEDFSSRFSDSFDLRPQPVTALSPLFSNVKQVDKLCRRTVNISKSERHLLTWLIRNRDQLAKASTKELRDFIVDDVASLKLVMELLKLENQRAELEKMELWGHDVPVFPVTAF